VPHLKGHAVATEFKLPELGENIESGDIVRVAVAKGDKVSEGQAVIELETDKAVIEVPSNVSGVIQDIKVKQGQKVKVGEVLFTLEGNGTGAKSAPKQDASKAEAAKPEVKPNVEAMKAEEPVKPAPAAPKAAASSGGKGGTLEFRLPSLGENIEAGDVVRIAVKAGDSLTEGQTVLELETDKAVIEVPATVSGVVKEVKIKQGQKLKVNDVIVTLEAGTGGTAKAAEPTVAPAAASSQAVDSEEHTSTSIARESYQAARKSEGKTEQQAFPPDAPGNVAHDYVPAQMVKDAGHEHRPPAPASPGVRRLARELGVDIYGVTGTATGGRISESDVKQYAKAIVTGSVSADGSHTVRVAPGISRVAPKLPDFSKWGAIESVAMRAVRRKTADHLSEAWVTIPHVTQHDKADVTEIEDLRRRFAAKAEMAGGKMTMTAIALKVVASALKTFPQFNASVDMANECVIYKRYIHIGVAVDTDRGLLVPVLRNVDQKNIIEIAAELSTLSKKAKDRKLTVEEMEGGTFTITNLGGIGGTSFTPIVNHPEVAILGMSRSRIEPVWVKDKFEPRTMLPLSLSYDHRLIDGADAARFVRWIVEALEQPFLLSVQG
jgi:pyruvate dehydrogenase E2 component (dihydrolipoamide acetyltransferase)